MTADACRRLVVVEMPPTAGMTDSLVRDLTTAVDAALSGTGPALAPVEIGPERDRIRAMLQPDAPLERDDIAAVLPTSGSTGDPKGVLLPAGALLHSAAATLARLGGPGRWVLALSPGRVAGLQVLVRSVVAGTMPVPVVGAFTPEAFNAATARARVAAGPGPGSSSRFATGSDRLYTALVPTQLLRLLDADPVGTEALRSYDGVLLGGGAASQHLLERARSAGVRVVTTYGMTETCGGCVYDGRPLDGVEVRLSPLEVGEPDLGRVEIAGPVVFAGYRLRPDLTAAAVVDGWHVTEDVGRWAPDRRLEVIGRLDDVVVSAGVNVPLLAVEQEVAAHPAIAEAGVVGVPDREWGARVVAYAVLRPGLSAPTLDDLRAHVAARHPRAWAPRELVIVAKLPLLASGKLDRETLRTQGRPARSHAS